ncbi:GDYXXLXY domain-containing protein [Rhizobium lentis]|uniref:GDYXXLXY domain-containing protein n=1 Tax=Rhizobium lentis TaxID=1138194 RepID=A0A9Q3M6G2_9HYPH|nr:GDYXXLXY domain-containing protein [Rhizobium lentis]MBX4954010.1 GDYXXLXY domain-containing protein [Rhizobium lentis]MBX4972467.1 GDYXXLXY domain-containing protein [Rhizobium lentis]MBX4984022.1 GDYXXLXY domain-containing protein [Rhizobium lentis]MBX4999620.1 GDYXXLXY domain-containing protein [Rhizobium lentis]MBX5002956.1 GDYXXLXY domain-containing protein [Rhizobium lentis]
MNSLMARLQSGSGYLLSAIIVASLQTVILGAIIQSRASILSNGAEVLLKTAPVDPRDFLRGDYVILNYDISTVPVQTISGGVPTEPGERTLWVRLKKQGDGFWTVSESAFHALPPQPETVILRSHPFYSSGLAAGDSVRVEYGIERYYVPEGQGKPIEEARNDGAVAIMARVSPDGSAQIRSLLVDGKPVYEEPLY